MKIESPPSFSTEVYQEVLDDFVAHKQETFLKLVESRYLYWDELKHRKDLPYDPVKSWALVKTSRSIGFKRVHFGGNSFFFIQTPTILQNLHEFDLKLIGGLYANPITPLDKTEYLKSSLLEEAIASSQIEGAATTTKEARAMLKSGRKPRNESEQMIFNNLRGIQFIQGEIENELDFRLIIEVHRIMTANTSASDCAGAFRTEPIFVQDHVDGEIAHTPPSHELLDQLMSELCSFVNDEVDFIHPIIKASIIHFMVGFIHPFKDGNGRTARAIFYWYLLKKGYSLIKNISISRAILDSRIQYDRAFLKTEQDGNDLTYFIMYSIKSLRVAFESLVRYRDKKRKESDTARLMAYSLINKGLNPRQAAVISELYFKSDYSINITDYAHRNNIVRQTARKDLNELEDLNLLIEEKTGRNVAFRLVSPARVEEYLEI